MPLAKVVVPRHRLRLLLVSSPLPSQPLHLGLLPLVHSVVVPLWHLVPVLLHSILRQVPVVLPWVVLPHKAMQVVVVVVALPWELPMMEVGLGGRSESGDRVRILI